MAFAIRSIFPAVLTAVTAAALTACGGGDNAPFVVAPEETRLQDTRSSFVVVPFSDATVYKDYEAGANGQASFTALAGTDTDRWTGTLGGAGYRVEVPRNWNGKLVMYAHGYRGTGNNLTVSNPSIRKYLIDNGYAWAASSYSKNYYDVRLGVEDTNALANAFVDIAQANGRSLSAPTKVYITGHSMGGHIAAAAVEAETIATANNVVRYHGSVPMCGVTGDMALFDTFTAMQVAAQTVAGFPNHPLPRWSEIAAQVNSILWITAPGAGTPITPTPVEGERYVGIVKNLTGGERPLYRLALESGGSFRFAYGTFGADGMVNGILNKWSTDTTAITYTIDGDPVTSAAINAAAPRITEQPDANRMRIDGLRWVPQINGQFSVPVVAIHTIGDLFVPFNMIQIYRQRAEAAGSGGNLVTRAIRGISHCDFTVSEQAEAFDAMIQWESAGVKPGGDDVTTASTVAAPAFGCTYTRAPVAGTDSPTVLYLRNLVATNGGACPAP